MGLAPRPQGEAVLLCGAVLHQNQRGAKGGCWCLGQGGAEQCRHPQHSSSHGSMGTADPLVPGCSPALLELGWQHQHTKLRA